MTLDWGIVVAIAVNLLAIVGVFMAQAGRFAKLELKTETMWDILVKDALIEARRQGVLVKQSPEKLNGTIVAQFGELGIRLRKFYKHNKLHNATENEVILLLAQHYADELIEKIAIPLELNLRQALIAAVQFCREGEDEQTIH